VDEAPSGRGLLDTSVVIAIDRVDPAELPAVVVVSALTLAELTVGPLAASDDVERARRQRRLQDFEANVEALAFDSRCARAQSQVYAAVMAAGRKARGARAVDLMIAATAFAHGLPLYTLNPKDLRGLDDLIQVVRIAAC
jgi:predicted nucleic acid-binding protein